MNASTLLLRRFKQCEVVEPNFTPSQVTEESRQRPRLAVPPLSAAMSVSDLLPLFRAQEKEQSEAVC